MMNKLIFNITLLISTIFIINKAYAETKCKKLNEEISILEKELVNKSKLLLLRKHELENLPADSTSIKMKLTADTFVIAAESETTQNWIESKRKEKHRSCGSNAN
jgi:GTPase involved in cell partitioning and DNA repair